MKITIIDDNPDDVDKIGCLLQKHFPEVKIKGKFSDPKLGLEFINEQAPDLLILDMEMGEMNGLELLKRIKKPSFEFVFYTSHDKYTVEAFKFFAIGYLFKPLNESEFLSTMTKTFSRMHNKYVLSTSNATKILVQERKRIAIPTQGCTYFTNYSNILRVEGIDNYTKIYLVGGEIYLSSYGIRFYEKLLLKPTFLRTHKSHMVNVNFVSKYYTDGTLIMKTGEKIPVAIRHRKELLKMFSKINDARPD